MSSKRQGEMTKRSLNAISRILNARKIINQNKKVSSKKISGIKISILNTKKRLKGNSLNIKKISSSSQYIDTTSDKKTNKVLPQSSMKIMMANQIGKSIEEIDKMLQTMKEILSARTTYVHK